MRNKCLILGTGTSQGVPVIGCTCDVCQSSDSKDKRLRSSVLFCVGGSNIVVDTGPDFRQQMLANKIAHLDGILFTHEHNDHVAGLDDIRPFNFMQKAPISVFASARVITDLKQKYGYIFSENRYPGAPSVNLNEIQENPFQIGGVDIQPIHYLHGKLPVIGFRVGDLAYLTDIKSISEKEQKKLKGLQTLVISALHHKPHHSHLNLKEALELIDRIQPKKSYLTHISHRMGKHEIINSQLPDDVALGYDGLELDISL